jgi:hypothetical protein
MTKREAMRQTHQENTLMVLGFSSVEAEALRRISMTLHRWHEQECGTGNGCIERDDTTGKPFWLNSDTMRRFPMADREAGARKRLEAIISARNKRAVTPGQSQTALGYYIQGDPRGAALYIIRPDDVPAGADVNSYYTRGICVY